MLQQPKLKRNLREDNRIRTRVDEGEKLTKSPALTNPFISVDRQVGGLVSHVVQPTRNTLVGWRVVQVVSCQPVYPSGQFRVELFMT
ncbi:hypothetical protein TIFTF001_025104 [Ficus carica]|uniref:Uncharacterized protein n=1 Tax=Ficus carica TaxID=3494 RepID=A0AA88AJ53_FICCA|nr:hypothetical protein TIFTF001_025104 [Ficus carica]